MTDAVATAGPVPAVAVIGATKTFGSVRALRGVTVEFLPGEVHILLGENGAGKSTIVNSLLGRYPLDSGHVEFAGVPVDRYSPAVARKRGVRAVLQDFSLVPTLPVWENLFLGRESTRWGMVNRRQMRQRAGEMMARIDPGIDIDAEVSALSRAERQLVEIAKAIDGPTGVLLLDEPTASISETEAERLFETITDLRARDWAICYISHRIEEFRRIGDRVTVLRDGASIATHALTDVTDETLVAEMIGRELTAVYPDKTGRVAGDEVLRIDGLTAQNGRVANVSLSVRAGEIVGIGGLVGSGKSEVGRALFGLVPLADGRVHVDGKPLSKVGARAMIKAGVGFIPEDRRQEGLLLDRSVAENITLEVTGDGDYSAAGLLRRGALSAFAGELSERVDVRPRNLETLTGALSGGNQQKVVLARALSKPRSLYVVIEPTAGIDMGARSDIYHQLHALCASGAGVLMISSDLEELVGLADRAYVMNAGSIVAEYVGPDLTPANVTHAAFGQHRSDPDQLDAVRTGSGTDD